MDGANLFAVLENRISRPRCLSSKCRNATGTGHPTFSVSQIVGGESAFGRRSTILPPSILRDERKVA